MEKRYDSLSLNGIIPPMITPLQAWNKLDYQGVDTLIEHILSGGVHGLFILGTTGEGPNLSYKLRRDLIQRTCTQVNGRVPLLVGVTDTSLLDSVKLAEYAGEYAADAVVAAPPYYFATNQNELIHYYERLADEITLPLFLYNMPSHTKLSFEPETVKILSDHPNIIGFKDSSGDAIYFQKVTRLLKGKPGFSIFVGPEEILMQTLLSGGHGGVNGGANIFPELYVAMYNAAIKTDLELMNNLQQVILNISSNLYTIGNSPAKYLQGIKCALSVMGLCCDTLTAPFQSFTGEEKDNVRQFLESVDIGEILS